MNKKYNNFITTGCSFTSGIFDNPNNDLDTWKNVGFAWPHYVFTEMWTKDSKFLNFAMPGGGNAAAINNLIYYFELNQNFENTLVGINLTGLERSDVICYADHPAANNDISTRDIKEKLNIGWINNGRNKEVTTRATKELVILNCLTIIQGITYLESNNIDYFFMLMNNYIYDFSPDWFQNFLNLREKNWVKFNNQISMLEFVRQNNLTVSKTDHHPNREGHQIISTYVLEHLKKYE